MIGSKKESYPVGDLEAEFFEHDGFFHCVVTRISKDAYNLVKSRQ